MFETLAPHVLKFGTDVVRLSIWLVLLMAVFVPLESLVALHPSKFWRKQVGVDLCWYFINSIFPALVIAVPLSFITRALSGIDPGGFYTFVASLPFWVKFPLSLFINDIGAYWAHRASHRHAFLWRFHAVHHSAESLDWLVNTRAHPIDYIFTRLCGLTPVYLLGLAQVTARGIDPTVAIITILGTLWSFFIHANVRIRLGPLEWLISTPAFHHWHHTNDQHRDRNFAAIFPLIDLIFRTSWIPRHWPPSYGIDQKMSPKLIDQLLDPLVPGKKP